MLFENEAYDIIVLAGQSNAQGTGRGAVDVEYIPDDDIITLSPLYTVSRTIENEISKRLIIYEDAPPVFEIGAERIADGNKIGELSFSFAKEYKKNGFLSYGRKILIIRAAIGATGFMHGQWGLNAPLYNKMKELTDYALSLNKENKLVAILWHQGEHEVGKSNPPENYRCQLKEMLTDFKARYSLPHLPIITADFTLEWRRAKKGKAAPISEVISEVITSEGGIFISTDDLLSNNQKNNDGDIIHYSREALYILGTRYFEAYQNIIKKSTINANEDLQK